MSIIPPFKKEKKMNCNSKLRKLIPKDKKNKKTKHTQKTHGSEEVFPPGPTEMGIRLSVCFGGEVPI